MSAFSRTNLVSAGLFACATLASVGMAVGNNATATTALSLAVCTIPFLLWQTLVFLKGLVSKLFSLRRSKALFGEQQRSASPLVFRKEAISSLLLGVLVTQSYAAAFSAPHTQADLGQCLSKLSTDEQFNRVATSLQAQPHMTPARLSALCEASMVSARGVLAPTSGLGTVTKEIPLPQAIGRP